MYDANACVKFWWDTAIDCQLCIANIPQIAPSRHNILTFIFKYKKVNEK